LTFFAGGAADIARESKAIGGGSHQKSTICSQRKPRSFRCSAHPAGSRGVRRINVWAVSCGGFRPLMMAVVMSASEKAKADSHTEEAIKHLEQAIDEGKEGHADAVTTAT
jgi:hypothetical protein